MGQPVERVVDGKAFDIDSGKLVYTIHTVETWEGGSLKVSALECRDLQGTLIYARTARFEPASTTPAVEEHYHNSGGFAAVWRGKTGTVVTLREKRGKTTRKEILTVPSPSVHPAGVNNMVTRNWDTLVKGGMVRFNMVAPTRLTHYAFRLVGKGVTEAGKRKVLQVQLEPDSAVLRMFAGDLVLTFDVSSRGMIEYRGMGGATDADGEPYAVRMVFDRPIEVWSGEES